jgi:hypothetical protein
MLRHTRWPQSRPNRSGVILRERWSRPTHYIKWGGEGPALRRTAVFLQQAVLVASALTNTLFAISSGPKSLSKQVCRGAKDAGLCREG